MELGFQNKNQQEAMIRLWHTDHINRPGEEKTILYYIFIYYYIGLEIFMEETNLNACCHDVITHYKNKTF